MFVRVVTISCKAGMEDKLRQIGKEKLIPINKNAGCTDIYFLEPTEDAKKSFGVVSMWREKELLDSMKTSEVYAGLRLELDPLTESVVDHLYTMD